MEIFSWAVYGLLLIAPFVLIFVGFLLTLGILAKASFKVDRKVGYIVLVIISIVLGWGSYKYFLQGPSKFNAACASGTGVKVFKEVKADSYILNSTFKSRGYLSNTDATIKNSILYVSQRKINYVELQDSNDIAWEYGNLHNNLTAFRTSTTHSGYFKVFIAPLGSDNCRWIMPEEIKKPLTYDMYLNYGLDHILNKSLRVKEDGKLCVAVDYVLTPSSSYVVEFEIGKEIDNNVLKHEIRVVDINSNNAIIGKTVAFEYKITNIYESIAFWIGNGKRHPKCPESLLIGHNIKNILNF